LNIESPKKISSKNSGLTPQQAADIVQQVLSVMAGRWKLVILFHLFDGQVRRFSELERLIPLISQKMLAQQLRQLEKDGVVLRTIYPEVPPRVEYQLTELGEALCPALDELVCWSWMRHRKKM
jgi:DNA-binding HxlR family transcriptional regulator